MDDQRMFISVTEAGRLLGVGRGQAYALAAAGTIPTVRISKRRIVVPLKAIEAMADAAIEQGRKTGQRTIVAV